MTLTALSVSSNGRARCALLRLAAMFAVSAAFCMVGRAQCPAPWNSAPNIYGTVFATGSGGSTENGTTLSVDQMMAAGLELSGGPCAWNTNSGATGVFLFNDKVQGLCEYDEVTYNGEYSVTGGGEGPAFAFLIYNSDSYSLGVGGGADTTVTVNHFSSACGSYTRSLNDDGWGPGSGVSIGPFPAGGAGLSDSYGFMGGAGDLEDIGSDVNWNFIWSFSPAPDNSCKSCKDQRGSQVSVQSQSLGEDIAIVGTPFHLHYESDRQPGHAGADATAIYDARGLGGWTMNVHHALEPLYQSACIGCATYAVYPKALFLGDGSTRGDYEVQMPVYYNGNTYLTSEDGSEVYVFKGFVHTQTLLPMTGAVLYSFGYDSHHELVSIADGSGNITTIQRDSNENPTAIVSPYGQVTTLTLDANGYLSEIADPAGHSIKLSSSNLGMLATFTDADGHEYKFDYDDQGNLQKDSDPAGGSLSLARTNDSQGYTVTETTALGVATGFTVDFPTASGPSDTQQFTTTYPTKLKATETDTQIMGSLSNEATLPAGVSYADTLGPDPRWGIQAPVAAKETITAGTLTRNRAESLSAVLGTTGDPFSITKLTDTDTINGRNFTSVYTGSNRTFVDTTAQGRKLTEVLDSHERVSSARIEGLSPVEFKYDARGRLTTITQGTRNVTLAYNKDGYIAAAIDPMNQKSTFTYDSDGNLLTRTFPDGRVVGYEYDASRNVTSITPPGKLAHKVRYTAVDLMSAYSPPADGGAGPTEFTYSEDRDLSKIARSDGATVVFDYDSADRLKSVTTPTETVNYSFDPKTGNLDSESTTAGESIAYDYNGPFPTSTQWSGPIGGKLEMTYNNNFWVSAESIDGEPEIGFTYDKDGLVTQAGRLSLRYTSTNGLLTGTTLLNTADAYSYNSLGEMTGYAASFDNNDIYKETYIRDADGRVASRTEVIDGKSNTYSYKYDSSGRLSAVIQNGGVVSSSTFDSNSNRIKTVTASGAANGTYDAQDRMLTYGSAKYTYTADGELASRTEGTQTTTYRYDALGNLVEVTLPDKAKISYVIDAEGRRVGKRKNGGLEEGFLYDGQHIVAQINGSGQIASQFIYGSHSTSPDYMIHDGETYRIFSDHLGSPRLVVNASSGAIAEEISYDEFGKVLSDTNPGFQPFGFAGGLYDQDTKLVRFGARDYDPGVGRWTAKDPLKFDGGDTNLYGYAAEDPINVVDASGLGAEQSGGLSGFCQRIRQKVKDAIKQKVGTIPLFRGPGIEIDANVVDGTLTAKTGAEVEVDGHEIAQVDATGTVGVTQYANPRAPVFTADADGNVSFLGITVWHGSAHTEVVTPNNWTVTKFLDMERNKAEGVRCEDPTERCLSTPYAAP